MSLLSLGDRLFPASAHRGGRATRQPGHAPCQNLRKLTIAPDELIGEGAWRTMPYWRGWARESSEDYADYESADSGAGHSGSGVVKRTVFEVHRDTILELEHDQPVVHDFAASDLCIHDVVEPGIWPLAFFPVSHELAVTKEVHRRLNSEIDGPKRELEIELTDPHLCRELSNHRRKIKVIGYAVHSGHSNWS